MVRLTDLDESARTGREFSDPSRGRYEVDWIDLRGDALNGVALKPVALKEFILANREALLAAAVNRENMRLRCMAG